VRVCADVGSRPWCRLSTTGVDASPDASVIGYRLLSGPAPGQYDRIDDVGSVTTAPLAQLPAGVPRYVVAVAYDAAGNVSSPSNEVSGVPVPEQPASDPACVFPTGDKAVLVTVTALQKTGSGGANSKARLDFQVASPGSPVTRVQVIAGDLVLGQMDGTDLGALAGLWFTVPATSGTYPLSAVALNAYGCIQTQGTAYVVAVP